MSCIAPTEYYARLQLMLQSFSAHLLVILSRQQPTFMLLDISFNFMKLLYPMSQKKSEPLLYF